ncbi:putative helicase [Haladaptatus paucihalophilus DX253]|uniref:CRISPR-associated helicase, Cas3 family n=1 Tax=Haladaptatus paucihalophilus DX253 TaxID=797209 RepID=E7QY01_HALPU|nr:CRISPR-associated endonuclease Cas3'' [Haladaptatus paucihalophilus]EFW90578.1 putative helicase [Haladaptatus paucihalophilus DX253]SHL35050.1 CRISPR-associated helicase, Cas3 family [Haladaptatus paucihalophilus DX253]
MAPDVEVRNSHPAGDGHSAVHLLHHLHDVRDRVEWIVPEEAATPSGESLVDVVKKLALVHDFGKATTWFQQYIDDSQRNPPPQNRYHSPLGAFAAYFVLRESGYSTQTCLAGFVAVAKHHGRLPQIATFVHNKSNQFDGTNRLDSIAEKVDDIDRNAPKLARRVFEEATETDDSWGTFVQSCTGARTGKQLFQEVANHVTDALGGTRINPEFVTPDFYGLVLECWGSLVLADKTSAAGAPERESVYEPTAPELETLDTYIGDIESDANADRKGSRSERLDYYRSKARTDILESVPEFVESKTNVATITLPTGMGKTLSGLSAALAIRDETDSDRVVYALPFTSIIDQVAEETRNVFGTDGTDGLLAVHHHLAETQFNPKDDADEDGGYDAADLNDDVAGMLGESWRSGLTVTTFVQLFESLAGPRNTQSMKLPALRDSVIVLDEPQSLPLDWWKLVPRLVNVLTDQYDATVIAMTATQPKLFEESGNAMSLVSNMDEYFSVAERVRYRLHDSVEGFLAGDETPLDYEPAARELAVEIQEGTATLAICNTIDSARKLTEEVTERVETTDIAKQYFDVLQEGASNPLARTIAKICGSDKRPFVHLSTRLRPTDRLALVRIIKMLREEGVQVVAVTTQLVEAGVDFSFEAVYRDIAPIDSIVQAAGRCNRSFEQEYGDVTVWWLAEPDEQDCTPAVAVYDKGGETLLPVTAAALDEVRNDDGQLAEQDVSRQAVESYYERLHEDKDVGKAEYVEYVDTADAESLGRLSLIDSTRCIDVIICLTSDDVELVNDLEEAYDDYDYDAVKRLVDETKPLRVSIPIYDEDSEEFRQVTNLPPLGGQEEENDVRVLRPDSYEFEEYFDATTGFVVPDASVEDRFL